MKAAGGGKAVILATPEGVGIDPQPPITLAYDQTHYVVLARYGMVWYGIRANVLFTQRWRVGLY